MDNQNKAAFDEFCDVWYEELRKFWLTDVLKNPTFDAIVNRFQATESKCAIIMPFSPVSPAIDPKSRATARYLCPRHQADPTYEVLFKRPMAIANRIEPPGMPGIGIYKTLLDDVPTGFIAPITDDVSEPITDPIYRAAIKEFGNREHTWMGFATLRLAGVYSLPLFLGKLPVYMMLLSYGEDNKESLKSMDLAVVTSMMQAAQRCFSSVLTIDAFEDILKKVVHAAKCVWPQFSPSNVLASAEAFPWKSWYQCVPGTGLDNLADVMNYQSEVRKVWNRTDRIDPKRIWETVADQFSEKDFFVSEHHEGWASEHHEHKREIILCFLDGLHKSITTRSDLNTAFEDALGIAFLQHTITLLNDAHLKEGEPPNHLYPHFDRLKSLFCNAYGDTGCSRLYPLTIRVCVGMAISEETVFSGDSCTEIRPKLNGTNARDIGWQVLKFTKLLGQSITNVFPQMGMKRDHFAVTFSLRNGWSYGNGVDAKMLTDILTEWGLHDLSMSKLASDDLTIEFREEQGKNPMESRIRVLARTGGIRA